MALISDINTAGASGSILIARSSLMQVILNGTWNGATVQLQIQMEDDSWVTVREWTDNAFDTIETVGSAKYRMFTIVPGTAPVLKCEVKFESKSAGRVE
jgi:hypothetical protein